MLIVFVIMIILLLSVYIFKKNYKKEYFIDLDKKEHPLKSLYPVGIWIMDIAKMIKSIVFRDKGDLEDSKFEAVYVRADKEKMRNVIGGKRGCYLWIILLIGSIMALGVDVQNSGSKNSNELMRQPFGEGSTTYQVEVDGIDESKEVIELEVSEQLASDEQLEDFFAEGLRYTEIKILNGNSSLEEIRDDMELIENTGTGIRLEWETDSEYISQWGEILAQDISEDGIDTVLKVKLIYGDYEKEAEIPIRILPKTDEMSKLDEFIRELKELETKNKENSVFLLPDTFDDKALSYRLGGENNSAQLFIIFLVAGVAVCYVLGQDVNKSYKKRNEQLLIDYAELVSKLTVLIGAGMTIKSAWERIVNDYKKSLEAGKCAKRYVYEEMLVTYYSMQSGIYEGAAYGEFGRRCGLYQYLKLGGILEQNVKKGVKGMSELLEKEAVEAFEEQKNIAKQFGQQASTKLLLPMVMMLGIVIVVVTVPAFMSFV